MKPRKKKEEELNQLHEDLLKAKNAIIAGYQPITVAHDTELRQKIRQTNSKYRVVKNTVAKSAAKGTPAEALGNAFDGPTAIAYNDHDPVALAKTLTAYAKANPAFVFKAGMVEGRVVNIADIGAIAAMPSREELISKVMFLLKAPAQRTALAVNAVIRNLAVVVKQAVDEKKFA